MLVTPNLKLWLPMEGNANDASGNGNNGSVTGASLVGGPKVYEEGTEHYNFEEYLQSGSGTSSKESDHLSFYADNDPNGEVALGTETTIDFTDINILYIDWEHISTPSENQDRSYIGIDADRSNINRSNAESGSIEVYKLNSNTNFNRKTEILDVSGLTGEKYIGVGAQLSSSDSQFVELKVYNIYVPTGKFGRCFQFDGSDDKIEMPSINMGDQYTILSWVKPTATTTDPMLMGKESVITIWTEEGNPIAFVTGDGSSWDGSWKIADTNLSADTWQHIAVRVDQTNVDFFLNGEADGSDTRTNRTWNSSFHIGGREGQGADYLYKGLADEFMLFNKVLSQSDIKRVMCGLHPISG